MNFVQITMQATTNVVADPTAFVSALRRQPGHRVRSQYRTMPACASVNAVKTPIT